MPNIYERLANSEHYKSTDFRLKAIAWSVALISGLSTAYANGFSHRSNVGTGGAILLALLTLAIVEGSLFTLEDGLRSTFKGGTQRALATLGKWLIKGTMCGNAAYLACVIGGVIPPPALLTWNRWSFAVHFAVGLILIPAIRDADPVVANRMLTLRAESSQEDHIVTRLSAAVASPFALLGARVRGALDGLALGWKLARNRQGFAPGAYVTNLNALARRDYGHVEGRQLEPGELADFPRSLPGESVRPPRRR